MENLLDKFKDDDILKKLYNNDLFLSEKLPESIEYKEISEKIRELEKKIIGINEETGKYFREYIECVSQRESIDMEFQFELGFKTAVKLLVQGLK